MLRPFVRALEGALSDTCAAFGVTAGPREGHPGCWVDPEGPLPRKIGALGLRVERGVTYHGVSLNVSVDLADFDLIDPCGMPGLASASIASELGRRDQRPSTESVARAAAAFAPSFADGSGPSWMASCSRTRIPPPSAPPWSGWPARCPRERGGVTDEPGPVRAAQGRHHRLVGRDDRGPDVRARTVRGAGAARRRSGRLLQLPPAGRRRDPPAHAQGLSRSRSPAPRRKPMRGRAPWRRSRSRTPGPRARGRRSWRRPANTGHSTPRHRHDRGAPGPLPGRDQRRPGRQPDAARAGRPELGRPGRCPDQPPVLRSLRPAADPAPDRGGAGRRGALPHPGRRVPVLPARPGGGPTAGSPALRRRPCGRLRPVCVPFAVRGLGGAPPTRRGLRPSVGPGCRRHRRGPAPGPQPPVHQPRRAALQPGPPHGAPQGAGGRDVPLALGDPSPAARDRGPGAGYRPPRQPGLAGGRGGRAEVRPRRGGPAEHPLR